MRDRFRMRLKLIWQAVKCRNCILLTLEDDEVDYKFSGNSLLFGQLYFHIGRIVPDWIANWHKRNDFTIDWDD